MLSDGYLPTYQFAERHQRQIAASAAQVMRALQQLPTRLAARLGQHNALAQRPPFGLHEFTLLACNSEEIVWGLAGDFWRGDYGLRSVADAAAFTALTQVPRLVLSFSIRPLAADRVWLHTETRVCCPDRGSYYRFLPYWYLIRPVSGLLRQRALRAVATLASTA